VLLTTIGIVTRDVWSSLSPARHNRRVI
jgi:hypothetical protein